MLIPIPARKGTIGATVTIGAYGGDIRQDDTGARGTIIRFNRNGHPVVKVWLAQEDRWVERTDRDGAAWLTNPDGSVIKEELTITQ
jgi:hypothetical protein